MTAYKLNVKFAIFLSILQDNNLVRHLDACETMGNERQFAQTRLAP